MSLKSLKIIAMKKYLIRSLKYFAALCVLYTAFMYAMYKSDATMLTLADDWAILVGTTRGRWMIAAAVALSAIYPKLAFVTRRVEGDTVENREQIIAALNAAGYTLVREGEERMEFRAGWGQRLLNLFEDDVAVAQHGQWIEISGIRRSVVRTAIRLDGYIRNHNRRKDE